ncbi:MAG: hypothetical protein R2864_07395 [Syntrophotaleaceae bacterium]
MGAGDPCPTGTGRSCIVAESATEKRADTLLEAYRKQVEWKREHHQT